MLEERPIRRRVGSARSVVSRVGSARPGSGRVSSARPSSDTRRPKLYTGRPNSAPTPSRPSSAPPQGRTTSYPSARVPLAPGSFKTHDVSHLNLKVEGKSIKSVSYTARRHHPVSRGSLRVISSHGCPVTGKRRQFYSSHKAGSYEKHELESDSEGSSGMGFGSTYTLPLPLNQPVTYGGAVPYEQPYTDIPRLDFGATYTKGSMSGSHSESRLGDTYTLKNAMRVNSAEEADFCDRPPRIPPDRRPERGDLGYHAPRNTCCSQRTVDEWTINDVRGELEDSSDNIRPTSRSSMCENVRLDSDITHDIHHGGVNLLKRDTDTTSNDGSECTVMSLGRKIQIMASSPPNRQLENNKKDENRLDDNGKKDENWDTEWKQLLKQNHELLLKLSSRDLHSPDMSDNSKAASVPGNGLQTTDVSKDSVKVGFFKEAEIVKPPEEALNFECEDRDELLYDLQEKKSTEDNEFTDVFRTSGSPECILEDIIEESTNSDKSSPRSVPVESTLSEKEKAIIIKSHSDKCADNTQAQSEERDVLSTQGIIQSKLSDIEKKSSGESSPSASDFSCTADLPTYHSGSAATYVVRSRFPRENQIKPQASKDLLEALQMIEDEEKKNPDYLEKVDSVAGREPALSVENDKTNTKPLYDPTAYGTESVFKTSGTSLSSKPQDLKKLSSSPLVTDCGASLPVLQVLVEKVFLFTQDLAERWKQGSAYDCQEELLNQVMEAERLLEHICIQEGRKEDPKCSPDLHAKCVEKARKKQEESDSRIQKNLELIRKLMDDKKLLTEQCEGMHRTQRLTEKKHLDKVKLIEERHAQEMKSAKERILSAEQEKREKWTQQKTKVIKETTYRGLETKMKDLSAKHRDEVSQLKAQHWEAMRETEEKFVNQLRTQEDELKKKFEQEKEEACKREREREHQRLEVELRQSEQLALSRMETVRKQHERDLKALVEEHHRTQEKLHSDQEMALKEAVKEKDQMKDQYENKIRALVRSHEDDIVTLRQRDEKSRSEWREQFMKEHNEARSQAERELRERLKRQRDKEIERAIKEIQLETSNHEEQEHRAFEAKLKNLRERYENELNELESSERGARSRYLEMKSILAQKEEEIVYLRARLHTQDLELCELQHMFRPPDD